MQRLTAAPRSGLTEAQVLDVLHAETLSVSTGCDLLNPDLTMIADISDELVDGTVQRGMLNTVHGTCTLSMMYEAAWGTQLARPYITLGDGALTARFNLGVYVLTTPEDVFGETPRTFTVQGYDRLYLLDRPVGDAYSVAAGTEYLTAVRDAVSAAGLSGLLLDGSAAGKTLPTAAAWPFIPGGVDGKPDQAGSTTWLRVVNDLLGAIGYRGVWADENGLFRSEPYTSPAQRPSEFTLNADDLLTIVGQNRTRIADQWKQPNRWVFVQRNRAGTPPPEPVEGAGIYTVPNSGGGLTWTRTVELDAADQASLVVQGDSIVTTDRRRREQLRVTTGPLPIAGHADVLTYTDAALGTARKVQAVSWSLPLLGADMSWELEVIT